MVSSWLTATQARVGAAYPIQFCERNPTSSCSSHPLTQPTQKLYAPAVQPQVFKRPRVQFIGKPMLPCRGHTRAPTRHRAPRQTIRVLQTESQPIVLTQEFSIVGHRLIPKIMGNRKPPRRGSLFTSMPPPNRARHQLRSHENSRPKRFITDVSSQVPSDTLRRPRSATYHNL